jgi:hypothetical protein
MVLAKLAEADRKKLRIQSKELVCMKNPPVLEDSS